MAAAGPPASLWRACQVVLFGGVLGFLASLAMAAVPGRRRPSGLRQGPCHPMEDATAPLPLCPERGIAGSKSGQLPPVPAVNESAVRAKLERRQMRVEEAQKELDARDKADRAEKERAASASASQQRAAQHQEAPPGEEVGSLPGEGAKEAPTEPPKSLQEKLDEQQRQKAEEAKEAQREEERERRRREEEEEKQRQEEEERKRAAAEEEEEEEKRRQEERKRERAAAEDGKEEEEDCRAAVKGDACFEHVVWSRRHGFHEHPEWYPGLTSASSFADFQYVLHVTGPKSKCPMPCMVKKERPTRAGCRTVSPGEGCYKQTLWAKTHGVYEHPEWYGKLTNSSSFEAFQDYLRTSGQVDCPRPCAPSLQLLQ